MKKHPASKRNKARNPALGTKKKLTTHDKGRKVAILKKTLKHTNNFIKK